MIEKGLFEITRESMFIPQNWITSTNNFLEKTEYTSVEDAWQKLVDFFLSDNEICTFWTSLGFIHQEEIISILNSMKNTVFLSVLYASLDELCSICNDSKNQYFGYNYLQRAFGEVEGSQIKNEFLSGKYIHDIYDSMNKAYKNLIKNTAKITDPKCLQESNPAYKWYLQAYKGFGFRNDGTMAQNDSEVINNFFPEINAYIKKNMGCITSDGNFCHIDDKEEKKIKEIRSLVMLIPLALIKATKFLPGHKNTKSGHWTIYSTEELNKMLTPFMNENFASLNSIDISNSKVSLILMLFAIEDLFHLKRLSFTLEKYMIFPKMNVNIEKVLGLESFMKSKREINAVGHETRSNIDTQLALFLAPLLYSPSVEIADSLFDSVYIAAMRFLARDEDCYARVDKNMQRVLSVNNIVFPSVLAIFTRLLMHTKHTISEHHFEDIICQLIEYIDKNYDSYYKMLSFSERCWNNPEFFQPYQETKNSTKTGKGKRVNINYAGDNPCMASINDILEIFMLQKKHRWKNTTIIDYNANLFSYHSNDKVPVNGKIKKYKNQPIYLVTDDSYLQYLSRQFLDSINSIETSMNIPD